MLLSVNILRFEIFNLLRSNESDHCIHSFLQFNIYLKKKKHNAFSSPEILLITHFFMLKKCIYAARMYLPLKN